MSAYLIGLVAAAGTLGLATGCQSPPPPKSLPATAPATTEPEVDVDVIHEKSRKLYNRSQDERDQAEADAILKTVKPALRKKTSEQLIEMFNSPDGRVMEGSPRGCGYYVIREGNKMIEAELRRRGDAARPALERHREDTTGIFTGSNGMDASVGWVCQSILDHQPPCLYRYEDPP